MTILRSRIPASLAAAVLVATGCGGEPGPADADRGPGGLAGACPDPIVVQANWWPQVENAALYHLLGAEYTIDTDRKRVTGEIVTGGTRTGARIEIRAGGPAIGFELAIPIMYADDNVMLAMDATDEVIARSATQPTIAVVSPLDITPQMIMWDPVTYPEFNTVVDIGLSDTTVLYFEGSAYMEYLVGSGILRRGQVDGSYNGNPDAWLATGGGIAQQGFATNEPYIYANELAAWNRPVKFQLVHHLGYPVYGDSLMIRADRKEELAECLAALVPVIQQSMVDYVTDPGGTNELIVELVDAYEGFPYSIGLADFTREQMLRLDIVGNGHNSTLGDFDLDRVQEILDKVGPIFTAQRVEIRENLTPQDLATNEFIDPGIGLR